MWWLCVVIGVVVEVSEIVMVAVVLSSDCNSGGCGCRVIFSSSSSGCGGGGYL